MYSRCLFCAHDLGRNEAIEAFPVGRRLAYDAAKGRLWVVCPACARWNLTPLEERWEAMEQAERLFRASRLRATTDNVGLARVAGGTEVIRVGRPVRPELAAWRYGDVFGRRRRRALAINAGVRAAALAGTGALAWWLVSSGLGAVLVVSAGIELVKLAAPSWAASSAAPPDDRGEFVVRVPVSGVLVNLSRHAVERARLEYTGAHGLGLTFPFGDSVHRAHGDAAVRGTAMLLAHMNAAGAPPPLVEGAVSRLVAAGDARTFVAAVGRPPAVRRGYGSPRAHGEARPTDWSHGLAVLYPVDRLALEMALHEDQERAALDGEMRALEDAWRDAESLAAIADGLGLPTRVERALARLRTGRAS